MPQQFLNNSDVHAAVERVRRKGMAEQVRVDMLFQSCPLADRADNTLDGTASRQYTGTQRYNSSMGSGNLNSNTKVSGTYFKEFVFCSKLETYNSQSDWPAISIAYFPLP